MIKNIFTSLVVVAFTIATTTFPSVATAAQLTGVKDTLSSVTVNTTATHVITATLVGANTFAAGDSITYDFVNADFTLNAIGNWQTSDFSFVDSTGSRIIDAVSSVSGTPPTCTTAGERVCITIDTTNNTFTVTPTSGGSFTPSSAASATTFTINGTTASGTGTMTNKATDIDSSKITITETTDSASAAVVAETNGTVTITATVDPTLTFSNSDAAIGFGTLSSSAERYADGDATGEAARTVAHTLAIGTNAPSGYTLTYSGALLTSGANTIAAATISNDANGTPGTSQFAIGGTETGDGAMSSGYDLNDGPDWNFVASTPTTLASASGVVSSSSIAMEYLSNISVAQASGSYSTSLTYVVTANF